MPKRPIYLQPSDHYYHRTRRDLEFLCNYWDRLLTPRQSCDIRLPELLRANHLMRHLSSLSLPSNQGLRVNVSFTILDDSNRLEPEETYQLGNMPNYTEFRNGFRRSPCNNTARHNDLLRNYIRQINENYIRIDRELMRARILAPLVERNIFGCQNTFYNQRAATCNWNKFPVGNRGRVSPRLHERHVNSGERNNHPTYALFGHKCCTVNRKNEDECAINQQSAKQKENSPEEFNDSPRTAEQPFPQTSAFCSPTVRKLQSNSNALQNYTGIASARNDNGTIKQQSSKEMEACQDVSKIISNATKISHAAESRPIKPDDDGVAINNSDKRSIDPVSCQENNLLETAESSVVTDQNGYVAEQGRGSKRKFHDLEDRGTAAERDLEADSQLRPRMTERIKLRVNDTPTTFIPDEKAVKRIRNGRIPMEGKSFWKKHVSTPRYASFLRMFRKEETNGRLRNNFSSQRNDSEKSQYRREISAESSSTEHDNRVNPRIERRTPTPRNAVHTTYNPIMHSSATDPTLDSSGLTIQLLRLAVALYAPTLMPALNSLIAQQNQQTPVSSSAFENSNDLLMQIFRLLNEQQSIPNLPLASIGSEKDFSALIAETNGESSRSLSEKKEETISTLLEESDPVSKQGSSISAGKNGWKSDNHVQNGKNRKWRPTSMLTDSDVRLNGNIFTAEDFRKFEEFLKIKKKRPEDVRSLSTKSKHEIVMKEYFRNWLHRLLRQLNSASSNLSVNGEERRCPEGSSRTADESSLEEAEGQRYRDHSVSNESPDLSKDDGNTFSEREEEDTDDQKSFTSATSTNSSRSQFKQNDATDAKNEKELPRNENLQD